MLVLGQLSVSELDMSLESEEVCGLYAGDAGRDEVHGGAVRNQDPEEGRCDPGWWCGVHDGWEKGAGAEGQATLPHPAPLLLPDCGERCSARR